MNSKTKRIVTIGMLCAITYLVMAVGRIPVVLFLKYDPSDIIVALGGLIWGPMTSCVVSVTVAVIEMVTVSNSYRNDAVELSYNADLYGISERSGCGAIASCLSPF